MARAKNADPARTIENILAAVTRLLDDTGPKGVAVRRVARLAELSPGTVAYYFPTRERLCEAALDAHYDRLNALVVSHARRLPGEDPALVLREAAHSLFSFARREQVFLRLELTASMERGKLSPSRSASQSRFIAGLAKAWPGLATSHGRLAAQTLVYAFARYACADIAELKSLTGARTADAAIEEVSQHLAAAALRLLAIER